MTWSQENCLMDNHCFTCERRGRDYTVKFYSGHSLYFFSYKSAPFCTAGRGFLVFYTFWA